MAIIIPKMVPLPGPGDVRGFSFTWGPMSNGDVGAAVDMLAFADRSIQVEGVFGSGGNVEIQGSNDAVNFRPLHDPLGNLLEINSTSDRIKHIMEITFLMRPAITQGDVNTSLTVTFFGAGSASRLGTGGSQ